MSFSIRLNIAIEHYTKNPKKFAESLGYNSPAKLYRLINDEKNNPSFEIIQDILRKYSEINARWLVLGEGEMFLQNEKKEISNTSIEKDEEIKRYLLELNDVRKNLEKCREELLDRDQKNHYG